MSSGGGATSKSWIKAGNGLQLAAFFALPHLWLLLLSALLSAIGLARQRLDANTSAWFDLAAGDEPVAAEPPSQRQDGGEFRIENHDPHWVTDSGFCYSV